MVQRDGGDVKLLNFNEVTGVLSIAMLGACRTCPSSGVTLKDGIERMMRHFLPEVKEVVEVKGHNFSQGYELLFPNEKALFREAEKQDRARRSRIKKNGKVMSFEELNEPDGA
jgi:Fe-S cluster biogenesis protein NfuA